MRKIHLLKAILDYAWFVTAIFIPCILIFIPLLFIYDFGGLELIISDVSLSNTSFFGKILITLTLLSFLLLAYSLFLFRKIVHYFIRLKIFDTYVIDSFRKTGNLLIISGLLSFITSVVSKVYFHQKVQLEIGISEHLVILCLGLFFLILSEIFTLAKHAKDENELTV